ncbi:zinc ribbon domain-containing protein [Paenibacillaceae bacterium WGS1546]|uniref:zinc ribbon domain-containing protein n=1 Tax=Cohnella sp. WGS1546 TaxID=3366810 RepID=UPI00372CF956
MAKLQRNKTRLLTAVGLIVVLLASGGYFLGKHWTDERRLLDRFESAVEKGQTDKLRGLLSAPGEEGEVGRETAEGLVEFMRDNPESMAALMVRLNRQAEHIRRGTVPASGADASFLQLRKKEKKRWLIFDDYELRMESYPLAVRTNYDGVQIWMNGRLETTTGKQGEAVELGPYLPGKISIKAVYEGEYTTLERERTVNHFPVGTDDSVVDMELEGDYVDVYASNSFARIFVNGRDIELAVGDGQRIGPIAVDGTARMRVEVDYPWGTAASEELPVEGSRMTFDVPALTEEIKNEVMEAARDFARSWVDAFQARDAAKLRRVHPERLDGFAATFAEMRSNDEHYAGVFRGISFDLDSFKLNQYSESEYRVTVKAKVELEETFYYGAYGVKPDPVADASYTEHTAQYENGQWLVSGWTDTDEFGQENVKVYE